MSKSLAPRPIALFDIPGCSFSKTGLQIDPNLLYDQWARLVSVLLDVEGAVQFWIGDALNFGEHKWGEKYSQAINETGRGYQTLRDYVWVCGNVNLSLRNDKLSFNHHRAVAHLKPHEQRKWLAKAAPANGSSKPRLSVHNLQREIQEAEQRERNLERIAALPDERFQLITSEIKDACDHIEAESIDAIITDPPYPQEYVPLYEDLAKLAAHSLKQGGSLLVMLGQSYLPEVLNLMTPHLRYHWTVSYLTPGGQSAQLWQRKVNTFWKPVLWFVKGDYTGDWVGDVARSAVNDNDKRFHEWGQSETGMADLIERFSQPGDLILDPFLGGGTTGVVALKLGRRFIGIDSDEQAIGVARERLGHEVE